MFPPRPELQRFLVSFLICTLTFEILNFDLSTLSFLADNGAIRELNPQHQAPEACALTIELIDFPDRSLTSLSKAKPLHVHHDGGVFK